MIKECIFSRTILSKVEDHFSAQASRLINVEYFSLSEFLERNSKLKYELCGVSDAFSLDIEFRLINGFERGARRIVALPVARQRSAAKSESDEIKKQKGKAAFDFMAGWGHWSNRWRNRSSPSLETLDFLHGQIRILLIEYKFNDLDPTLFLAHLTNDTRSLKKGIIIKDIKRKFEFSSDTFSSRAFKM